MDAQLLAGDGQILAGRTKGNDVHGFDLRAVDVRDAAELFHVWKTRLRYPDGERFDFRSPHRLYAAERPGQRKPRNAVEKTA